MEEELRQTAINRHIQLVPYCMCAVALTILISSLFKLVLNGDFHGSQGSSALSGKHQLAKVAKRGE